MVKKKKYKLNKDEISSLAAGLSISLLDNVLNYITSENLIVTRLSVKKMFDFFEYFNTEDFDDDREAEVRIFLIKKISKAIGIDCIKDEDVIRDLCYAGGKYSDDEITEVIDEIHDISNEVIVAVDGMITTKLKYINLSRMLPLLQDHILDFQAANFDDLQTFIDEQMEPILHDAYSELKKVKALTKASSRDFNLSRESLHSTFEQTIELRRSPGASINTGIKKLNSCLGGKGYEAGRVYVYLGVSGKGKSIVLLNSVTWAHKYNPNLVCFDKTKKPAILYVTMENDIPETTERLFSNQIGTVDLDGSDLVVESFEINDLMDRFEEEGFNDDHIQIFFKYRKNRSIDTNDIAYMIEEMEAEGYECKLLAVDYTKRINSIDKHNEEFMRLGAVIDDFSSLAKEKNFPVVTAGQMNREAMAKLEQAIESNKDVDITKKLQGSQIAGAIDIVNNADWAGIINPEEKISLVGGKSIETEYLAFKRFKLRGRPSSAKDDLDYLVHPFDGSNRMKFLDDFNLDKSLSLLSLASEHDDPETSEVVVKGKARKNPSKSKKPIAVLKRHGSSMSFED